VGWGSPQQVAPCPYLLQPSHVEFFILTGLMSAVIGAVSVGISMTWEPASPAAEEASSEGERHWVGLLGCPLQGLWTAVGPGVQSPGRSRGCEAQGAMQEGAQESQA